MPIHNLNNLDCHPSSGRREPWGRLLTAIGTPLICLAGSWFLPLSMAAAPLDTRHPTLAASSAPTAYVVDSKRYHLGTTGKPEWDEFAGASPAARRLQISFTARANTREHCLLLWQDNVKLEWGVEINDRKIGKLFLMEEPLWHSLSVSAGTLREGSNTLTLVPPKENDDIRVGSFTLYDDTITNVLGGAALEVEVVGAEDREPLPSRLTLVDAHQALAALIASPAATTAARPGVVYTANGRARIGLLPGEYTVYAGRGFEYGLAQQRISVTAGTPRKVSLTLAREVDTRGLVSCDTHTHTFTHSRHGDATIEERVITLAGEGIELPISTDHNFLTDYEPAAILLGVRRYFTPVIGNEVTTPIGHFNTFPIDAGSRVPDFRRPTWPALLKEIRDTPGVRVVILNHPHNVHSEFQPFARTNFNTLLGQPRRVLDFSIDAIELVNSSALQSDPKAIFADWFALLNAGHRVTGIGSSDVHDVSRYIIGQGRTYIVANDSNPGAIDVGVACRSLLAGRAMVSLGLLPLINVNDQFHVGDLATGIGQKLEVSVEILAPSWVKPEEVELFANGVSIQRRSLAASEPDQPSHRGHRIKVVWDVPRPPHDVHLVAIATGAAVTGPFWSIPRPYQPRSGRWAPICLGCTNPVWVDADGDGRFTSTRGYASLIVEQFKDKPRLLFGQLAAHDALTSAHAADLLIHSAVDILANEFQRDLAAAAPHVREGFAAGVKSLNE